MNTDESWDVNKYKLSHESERIWNFRKKFLVTYKDKFPEDKLKCLAQVFINIKFLDCTYPQHTMDLIDSLTKDLFGIFIKKKNKFQQTFITPEEAQAEANCQMALNNNGESPEKFNYSSPYHPDYIVPGLILLIKSGAYPHQVLENSCSQAGAFKITFKFYEENYTFTAKLYIQNKFIAYGFGISSKLARKDATIRSYKKLKEHCFIILEKDIDVPDTINKNDIIKSMNVSPENNSEPSTLCAINELSLPEDNIGNKLLRNMGWKIGSGLGKNGQGRTEPITVIQLPKNMGFGTNSESSTYDIKKTMSALRKEVNQHLKEFKNGPKSKLLFSTEFTKDERKLIHMLSLKVGLKTRSYGVNACRHIVISKKCGVGQIFQELMENEAHEDDNYKLIFPNEYQNDDVSTNEYQNDDVSTKDV